jgi:hypothetical protein
MRLISHDVDLMPRYDNRPTLRVVVDHIPDTSEMRFEKRGPLYFAEKDGFVRFFHYDHPDRGYDGAVFTVTMTDGAIVNLKGPWSSRSGVMNAAGFTPSMEVNIKIEGGPGWRAGHASIEWLQANGVKLVPVWHGYEYMKDENEPMWEPCDENGKVLKPFTRFEGQSATSRYR